MFEPIPKRKIVFLVADAIIVSFAVYLAFLLRFEGQIPAKHFLNVLGMIILATAISLPIFYFFKLYFFSWAYVSTRELISLSKALVLSFLFLAALLFVLRDLPIFSGFPRSTLFISFVLIFIFSGGIRFAKRIYLQLFQGERKERERTLIVGAGNAGEQILRNMSGIKTNYLPVGFVDDDPAKQGILIHGIKVLGRINDIPKVVEKERVEGIIIALPSVGSAVIRQAVELGRTANLKKIKIIPSFNEILNGQVTIGNLRELEVGDLLGRDQVSLDKTEIEDFVNKKRILVTGAAGSIGSELCRQLTRFSPRLLLLLDQDETGLFNISEELEDKFPRLKIDSLIADIRDKLKIDQIFNKYHPNIIFHAAAYKHVPLMESHPEEAVKNNIFGTEVIARASLKYGVEKFIFISTDKAVNPRSVMGATKRIGEMLCQTLNQTNSTKFISVRFGNVLDSRGSVIPIFREQIKRGGPVEITHPEMKRYFMTSPEACLLVMEAGAMGQGGEVFVLDMGEPIKILDLAREMIRFSGLEADKDIPIVFTGPRPGEKLFEEILTAEEGTISTQSQKIFRAKLSAINKKKLDEGLEKIERAAEAGDRKAIINILKVLILNYG